MLNVETGLIGLASPQKIHPVARGNIHETWYETIANLFTAMVIIDGKVLPIEIETLEDCLNTYSSELEIETTSFRFSSKRAKHMYKTLKGPGGRFWLGNQHMKLKDFPDRIDVLESLWKLSICDSKLDQKEGQLIDIFAHLWRPC